MFSCLVLALTAVASPLASSFDRFFVIVLENTDYASAMADPYLGTTLLAQGTLLDNYAAVSHPSEPNYVAMISGGTNGVTGDGTYNLKVPNVADKIEAAGLTWTTYQENYPGNCFTGDKTPYRRKHNPFISFTSISGNAARCANIVSADQLATDISAQKIANYVFYTPNMNNDGHDTGVTYASNWLKSFLPPLLANPVFSNTLFLVTFDENEGTSGNQVYAVLLGSGTKPGSTDSATYTHYSQLATLTKYWGIAALGSATSAAPFALAF